MADQPTWVTIHRCGSHQWFRCLTTDVAQQLAVSGWLPDDHTTWRALAALQRQLGQGIIGGALATSLGLRIEPVLLRGGLVADDSGRQAKRVAAAAPPLSERIRARLSVLLNPDR